MAGNQRRIEEGRKIVKPGQTWKSNDPRGNGRNVVVRRLTDTHACVTSFTLSGPCASRETRIRLDRFKSGYTLVKT